MIFVCDFLGYFLLVCVYVFVILLCFMSWVWRFLVDHSNVRMRKVQMLTLFWGRACQLAASALGGAVCEPCVMLGGLQVPG